MGVRVTCMQEKRRRSVAGGAIPIKSVEDIHEARPTVMLGVPREPVMPVPRQPPVVLRWIR